MTVTLTPTPEIASSVSFLIYLLWSFFSGFFISRKVNLTFLACNNLFRIQACYTERMLTMLKQMIPVWWRWLYWVNPAAWTLYGLMFSQLGDLDKPIHVPGNLDQPINVFVQDLFGFQDNDFTIIVALHFGVIVLFLSFFGFSIEKLNFQIRWLNWKRCLKQGVAHVDLFSTSIVTTANSQLRQGAQKIIFIIFSLFFFL